MANSNDNRDGGNGGSRDGGKNWQSPRVSQLTLTAWELEKDSEDQGDSGRAMQLRSLQRLESEIEQAAGVPTRNRSIILVVEDSAEAVLIVHGSTGSPADVRALAEHLHRSGLSVYASLLPGHGTEDGERPEVKWQACLQEVLLRYRMLSKRHRRVHVVGFSFGAALAILLARRESVASLCLLAPALVPRLPLPMRVLIALHLHHLPFLRKRFGWDLEVLDAMEAARGSVGKLRVPVYAAHCSDDDRISPHSLRILQKKVRHRAARFRLFPEGGHMILEAHGGPSLNDEILRYIRGGS